MLKQFKELKNQAAELDDDALASMIMLGILNNTEGATTTGAKLMSSLVFATARMAVDGIIEPSRISKIIEAAKKSLEEYYAEVKSEEAV